MHAKITSLEDKLRQELDRHYGRLFETYPQLENLGLVAKSPQDDPIWLPSRLPLKEVEELNVTDLWEAESQLRIGQAYDAIRDLRKALGLRSWWSRHVKAQNDSQMTKTKGQSSLLACRAKVREASRIYSICYHWLHKMAPGLAKRFGFQELKAQDLVLLNDWLEGGRYRTNEGRLPWIWTLQAPVDSPSDPPATLSPADASASSASMPPSSLENIVETWRNEYYVHAAAASERWIEEVEILRYEMVRIYRWFRYQALWWAWVADERATVEDEDGSTHPATDPEWASMDQATRGSVAYASRKFSLFVSLANHASEEFIPVMGQGVWDEVWKGPTAADANDGMGIN
ncbi:hypothetical protein FRC00_011330 [Tulasnella sp. 408]|nr:hypothetical protein FRC00_011330 [Tulasnella sp. 408]